MDKLRIGLAGCSSVSQRGLIPHLAQDDIGDRVIFQAVMDPVEGRVMRIASQATTVGGDVVYEVVIELDEQPSDLRWGMSVEVEITTS